MTALVMESNPVTSRADPAGSATRRRIALVGHACSPYLGSEPGFTWKWATNLARLHAVTCFCHPEHRSDIEKALQSWPGEMARAEDAASAGPQPAPVEAAVPPRFVFVGLDPQRDPWKPAAGEKGIRLHYARWQHRVMDAVLAEHRRTPFDLVHHVSWGSLNQPPQLWRTGLPFVWGPIGGGQSWPEAFIDYADSKLRERLRRWVVRSARFNPAVVRCARSADLVLATNHETAAIVRRAGARRVEMLLDSGFALADPGQYARQRPADAPFTLLWAGRLEPRKGLLLGLEALAQLNRPDIRLLIAGDGPQRPQIEAAIDRLHLRDRALLLGQVPYAQMTQRFAESDAFLFTSLRDSMGSVVLEAMSAGLPVICLDHQGVAVAVSAETGIKVPVTTPQQVIAGLADAIARLADDPNLCKRLGDNVRAAAADNTWPRRAEKVSRWYEEVLHAR